MDFVKYFMLSTLYATSRIFADWTMGRSSLFVLLTLIYAWETAAALTSSLGPVVDVGYAAFAGNSTSPTGIANGPVTFFGNIPYAQPPLGNLRFRAPQPLNEHATASSVSDARNWGPPCIQRPAVVGIGSEGKFISMFS